MVELNGYLLTLNTVKEVLTKNLKVVASKESLAIAQKSRDAVDKIVADKKVVYGINTGFGKFSDVPINQNDVRDLQINLIRSHACGVGEPFPKIVSKVMLLLRANALLK